VLLRLAIILFGIWKWNSHWHCLTIFILFVLKSLMKKHWITFVFHYVWCYRDAWKKKCLQMSLQSRSTVAEWNDAFCRGRWYFPRLVVGVSGAGKDSGWRRVVSKQAVNFELLFMFVVSCYFESLLSSLWVLCRVLLSPFPTDCNIFSFMIPRQTAIES